MSALKVAKRRFAIRVQKHEQTTVEPPLGSLYDLMLLVRMRRVSIHGTVTLCCASQNYFMQAEDQ